MNVDFLKDGALAVAQEQHLQPVMKMIVGAFGRAAKLNDFKESGSTH